MGQKEVAGESSSHFWKLPAWTGGGCLALRDLLTPGAGPSGCRPHRPKALQVSLLSDSLLISTVVYASSALPLSAGKGVIKSCLGLMNHQDLDIKPS